MKTQNSDVTIQLPAAPLEAHLTDGGLCLELLIDNHFFPIGAIYWKGFKVKLFTVTMASPGANLSIIVNT